MNIERGTSVLGGRFTYIATELAHLHVDKKLFPELLPEGELERAGGGEPGAAFAPARSLQAHALRGEARPDTRPGRRRTYQLQGQRET